MEKRRVKKWEKVKAHKSLNPSRNKTQETTEEVQKNSRDTENKEISDLPITVNYLCRCSESDSNTTTGLGNQNQSL